NIVWDYTERAFDMLEADKSQLLLYRRGSSDHVPFHNKGITAAAISMGTANGGLEPEYHTSSDMFEMISQERLQHTGDIIAISIFEYFKDLGAAEEQEEEDLPEAS